MSALSVIKTDDRYINDSNRPTISLAMLLDFSLQRTYHEMIVLSELLPRKTDFERKIEILQFAEKARRSFVRILGVIKWVHNQEQIKKCDGILTFLENQKNLFTDTADYLAKMARETLIQARLPKYAIREAANVIVDGKYPFIPLCVKKKILPPPELTPEEKILVINRLDMSIRSRLTLEGLPPLVKIESIENGQVSLYVDNEFRVLMTLMMGSSKESDTEESDRSTGSTTAHIGVVADLRTTWRLLELEILVGRRRRPLERSRGKGSSRAASDETTGNLLHASQLSYLHNVSQLKLIAPGRSNVTEGQGEGSTSGRGVALSPLWELYQFLHTFCLGLGLESMYSELSTAIRDQQIDPSIKILNYVPGQELLVTYWSPIVVQGGPAWWDGGSEAKARTRTGAYDVPTAKKVGGAQSSAATTTSNSPFLLKIVSRDCDAGGLLVTHAPPSLVPALGHVTLTVLSRDESPAASPNEIRGLPRSTCHVTGVDALIRATVRERARHKIILLRSEWLSQCIGPYCSKDITIDGGGLPYWQVTILEPCDDSERVVVAVDRSSGQFRLSVPKYPDASGHLLPILESVLNTAFDRYVAEHSLANDILTAQPNVDSKMADDARTTLTRVLTRAASCLKLYILVRKMVDATSVLPFVTFSGILSASAVASTFLRSLHDTTPPVNQKNKMIDVYAVGLESSVTTQDIAGPESVASTETAQQPPGSIISRKGCTKDQKHLLTINFTKFKDSKLIVKYREVIGGSITRTEVHASTPRTGENLTSTVPTYYRASGYRLYYYFDSRGSKPTKSNSNSSDTVLGPLSCLKINAGPETHQASDTQSPWNTLARLSARFECLVPMKELFSALSSTLPTKYHYKPRAGGRAKESTSLVDMEIMDPSASCGLGLHLNFYTAPPPPSWSLKTDREQTITNCLIVKGTGTLGSPRFIYYTRYYISRATLTLQGKTSRYWFATVELEPKGRNLVQLLFPEATSTYTLRRFVYFQYFAIPASRYVDVAEAFWRDLDMVTSFGSNGDLFKVPPSHPTQVEGKSVAAMEMDRLVYYNYKRMTLAYGPAASYYVTIHWSQEQRRHKLTFSRPSYVLGPDSRFTKSSLPDDYRGNYSNHFSPNPHNALKSLIESEFNKPDNATTSSHHKSIFWLLEVLDKSIPTLDVIHRFPNYPSLGSFNKFIESFSSQTFTVSYLSLSHIRLTYRKTFCIDFQIIRAGTMISIRDSHWALKQASPIHENSFTSTLKEPLAPLPNLEAFISSQLSKTRASYIKEDQYGAPNSIKASSESVVKLEPTELHSDRDNQMASSIVTLGNLDLDSLLGEPNVLSTTDDFDQAMTSTPQIADVFQPSTLLPMATNFFEPAPTIPKDTEIATLNAAIATPFDSRDSVGASKFAMIRHYFEVFRGERWVDIEDFRILCSPTPTISPISLAYDHGHKGATTAQAAIMNPLEKHLGCAYTLKHLVKIVQNEDNLVAMPSPDPNIVTFQANALHCQVYLDPVLHYEELKIKFYLSQQASLSSTQNDQGAPGQILNEYDFLTLETFFKTKVACPPYRINSLVSYCRILAAPLRILKDCVEIMKLESLSQSPLTAEGQGFKWSLHWCLTIPPSGPVLAPVGTPAVVIKNKMLFFVEIRRKYPAISSSTGLPSSSATQGLATSNSLIVIPIVHDLGNNTTQLADPRAPNAPPQSTSPSLNVISNVFKRFAEYHMNPKECSLYPAVRELITNLVFPTTP